LSLFKKKFLFLEQYQFKCLPVRLGSLWHRAALPQMLSGVGQWGFYVAQATDGGAAH